LTYLIFKDLQTQVTWILGIFRIDLTDFQRFADASHPDFGDFGDF